MNTQSNAGNHGFNMISKYPRADYVCLAQREVALETRNQQLTGRGDGRARVGEAGLPAGDDDARQRRDAVSTRRRIGFTRVPALATQVVDRVGAGDAVLCVTALCAAAGATPEVIAFIGNVVGAEAVAILGNQRVGRTHPDVPPRRVSAQDAQLTPAQPEPQRKKKAEAHAFVTEGLHSFLPKG